MVRRLMMLAVVLMVVSAVSPSRWAQADEYCHHTITVGQEQKCSEGAEISEEVHDPRELHPCPAKLLPLARCVAWQLLRQYEAAAHHDPLVKVRDDANHTDGGLIVCRHDGKAVDCKTTVAFYEDAYKVENGQAVYAGDQVSWTMRFAYRRGLEHSWLMESFPAVRGKSVAVGRVTEDGPLFDPFSSRFGGRALKRRRVWERNPIGSGTVA